MRVRGSRTYSIRCSYHLLLCNTLHLKGLRIRRSEYERKINVKYSKKRVCTSKNMKLFSAMVLRLMLGQKKHLVLKFRKRQSKLEKAEEHSLLVWKFPSQWTTREKEIGTKCERHIIKD